MILAIIVAAVALTLSLAAFILKWSGGGEFDLQARIDLMTIVRRTGQIMAQLDDLMSVLNTVAVDVGSNVGRLSELQSQLTALQNSTPPEVNLQPAIDLANSIRQSLEGTVAAASTVPPATSDPSVEPPASTTSGDTQQPQPDTGTAPISE